MLENSSSCEGSRPAAADDTSIFRALIIMSSLQAYVAGFARFICLAVLFKRAK